MSACQHILCPRHWPLNGNSELFCERCGKTQKEIYADRTLEGIKRDYAPRGIGQ